MYRFIDRLENMNMLVYMDRLRYLVRNMDRTLVIITMAMIKWF